MIAEGRDWTLDVTRGSVVIFGRGIGNDAIVLVCVFASIVLAGEGE